MISKRCTKRYVVGLLLIVSLSGLSPLAAQDRSKSILVAGAAISASKNTAHSAKDQQYCIREAVNSRIRSTYCMTKKEWSYVGVDLSER
jgi:hypothetical protein